MKEFDELLRMSDEQRLTYLQDEVERLIEGASKGNVLKLRLLQARMDATRRRVKNPKIVLELFYADMLISLNKLNEALH